MPDHGRNGTYELWNSSAMLCRMAHLAEHWAIALQKSFIQFRRG